jgi:hypothetical protein
VTLPETISTHVRKNCRKEFVPRCGLYRASIDLNGYTYARVRKTEEEAVADLVSACSKSLKWQAAFRKEKTTSK